MHSLEAGQLNRLLRDLELTASAAIRRGAPLADQYLWLVTRVRCTDAREDPVFQQRLARYIGLRGKLRACKPQLFDVLETLKALPAPSFDDALLKVSELTGQVEKSVASSLLSLLDPEQPTIDRDLRELLPRYGFPALAEAPAFDECVAWHRQLVVLFEQVIRSPRWPAISSYLDGGLPAATGAVLTEARKLNLHLTHARRVVALMPTLQSVASVRAPAGLPTRAPAEPTAPRATVRLHLCR
jgi:hypothetical protein